MVWVCRGTSKALALGFAAKKDATRWCEAMLFSKHGSQRSLPHKTSCSKSKPGSSRAGKSRSSSSPRASHRVLLWHKTGEFARSAPHALRFTFLLGSDSRLKSLFMAPRTTCSHGFIDKKKLNKTKFYEKPAYMSASLTLLWKHCKQQKLLTPCSGFKIF